VSIASRSAASQLCSHCSCERLAPRQLRARGDAVSEGHRRNRSWAREHPGQRDAAWFKREIAPKLDAFSLKEIAAATGLSLAACSRIRAGARVPRPRHWDALLCLVEGTTKT
jgi:hypothetical protein